MMIINNMATENDIKRFMQDNRISVPQDDAFMEELVRQINLLPIPASLSETDTIQDNLRILQTIRMATKMRHRRQALMFVLTDIAICAAIFLVGHLLLPATASSPALQLLITWRYLILGLMSLAVVIVSSLNAWRSNA